MRRLIITCLIVLPILTYAQDSYGDKDIIGYKIESIFFEGGSYYIDEDQKQKIMEFLEGEILENYEIHIHSHTDNIGSMRYNQWLSEMRSYATYRELQNIGIALDQLFIKDHGLHNPEFDNNTWEGRAQNRRVDIVLWPLPL